MRRFVLISFLAGALLHAQPPQEFNHFQGYFGAGFTTGVSDFGSRHDTGWNILAGGGYRFNPALSLNLEYTYNNASYNFAPQTPGQVVLANRYDGRTELHGITVNPRYTIGSLKGIDAYVQGGYGIYARNFTLTRPTIGTTVVCDPYWFFCGTAIVPVNVIVGSHTTWKQGWNAGIGLEFGARVKFFADARYLWVANPQVRIESIPVSFGVRF
jgi:opacity protein-like surface antigen